MFSSKVNDSISLPSISIEVISSNVIGLPSITIELSSSLKLYSN
ncbi:hypothetical protein [uncultured Clostridium sp.]|nr:hypothetical protein [uncultured Clostridium sp.]